MRTGQFFIYANTLMLTEQNLQATYFVQLRQSEPSNNIDGRSRFVTN